MISIQSIKIENVRNLLSANLPSLGAINILHGGNGSGKTSVLESIHLLSTARTFRSHKLKPLINTDAESCTVFAEIEHPSLGLTPVGVQRSKKGAGAIKIGGSKVSSAAKLAETLPLQLINAESFELLSAGPSVRRQFLDWGVFHVEHGFLNAWKVAQNCLKQRNTLLRHDRIDRHQLAPWTAQLAEVGEQIDQYRQQYLADFMPIFNDVLPKLLDIEGVGFNYYRGWDKDSTLFSVLEQGIDRDMSIGHTQSGPHRADIRIRYQGSLATDILSRGQQKLVVCAMRLAQGLYLKRKTGRDCVFLVDDLPAELDEDKRARLCEQLEALNTQVFITCVEAKEISGCWSDSAEVKVFHVEQGHISQENNP